MSNKRAGKTKDIFSDLDEKVETLYRHQSIMGDYSSIPRDYGTGFLMSEVEAHTLGYVQQYVGLTATRLAVITNRTKGTISQVISRLEEQGLIRREVNPKNKREYKLYVTDYGERTCEQHRIFDRTRTFKLLTQLLESCTPEEIDGFFRVLRCRIRLFTTIIQEDKSLLRNAKKSDTD